MILTQEQLAILDKFDFDVPPVGVKFFAQRPDMVERLDEDMALCEMLKRAQEGNAFLPMQKTMPVRPACMYWDRQMPQGLLSVAHTEPGCRSSRTRVPPGGCTTISRG